MELIHWLYIIIAILVLGLIFYPKAIPVTSNTNSCTCIGVKSGVRSCGPFSSQCEKADFRVSKYCYGIPVAC